VLVGVAVEDSSPPPIPFRAAISCTDLPSTSTIILVAVAMVDIRTEEERVWSQSTNGADVVI
jgi:hypothetical protein